MNFWLISAAILLLCMIPCGWICMRGSVMERFVSLQMGQILTVLILMLLAEGYSRSIYFDLSLVLAVLAFASGLVYVRFLERWL
jgi:multicomponent Na+:H+ antiporter subunit F